MQHCRILASRQVILLHQNRVFKSHEWSHACSWLETALRHHSTCAPFGYRREDSHYHSPYLEASSVSVAGIALVFVGLGAGLLYLNQTGFRQDGQTYRTEKLPPQGFSQIQTLGTAVSKSWVYLGQEQPDWQGSKIRLRIDDEHAIASDQVLTARMAGKWSVPSNIVQLESAAVNATFGSHLASNGKTLLSMRIEDLMPPKDVIEGDAVTVHLLPGFGLVDLYGQPGLYTVHDESQLRQSELARSGRYNPKDFYSGRANRIQRALESLASEASISKPSRQPGLEARSGLGSCSVADASQKLGLSDKDSVSSLPLVQLLAQLLDSQSPAFEMLVGVLKAQCAAGPDSTAKATELKEVLRRHATKGCQENTPVSIQQLEDAWEKGYFATLPADESGMHLREREADRLLERARRELWVEGSASRRELEVQIQRYLCLHAIGKAATMACLRFTFIRSSKTSSADVLRAHKFLPVPGLSGIWWRLNLEPLELPLL